LLINYDFIVRSVPDPQNSFSPTEPRDDEPIIPAEADDLAIWHFDENSGSIAYDSTANHNDLSWGIILGWAKFYRRGRKENGIWV